jgi:hypothetical protein
MNRQLYVFVIVLGVVALAAGTGAYLAVRPRDTSAGPDPSVPTPDLTQRVVPRANALGPDDRARLPADRQLLPAADEAECRGLVVSGHSQWGLSGLTEKSVLWDEAQRHLVVLLPNEQLTTLQQKLTPT